MIAIGHKVTTKYQEMRQDFNIKQKTTTKEQNIQYTIKIFGCEDHPKLKELFIASKKSTFLLFSFWYIEKLQYPSDGF